MNDSTAIFYLVDNDLILFILIKIMQEAIVATTQYYYPVIFSSFTLAPLALLILPTSILMLALNLKFLGLGREGKKDGSDDV
ncbi:hypothetical protein A9Q74_08820 [Colwellia sp. 39_35_sub15_T18]|nr:hypothetical protein A9Q74_08820 [Colwellia sp. 39_35_sub15_T18]